MNDSGECSDHHPPEDKLVLRCRVKLDDSQQNKVVNQNVDKMVALKTLNTSNVIENFNKHGQLHALENGAGMMVSFEQISQVLLLVTCSHLIQEEECRKEHCNIVGKNPNARQRKLVCVSLRHLLFLVTAVVAVVKLVL